MGRRTIDRSRVALVDLQVARSFVYSTAMSTRASQDAPRNGRHYREFRESRRQSFRALRVPMRMSCRCPAAEGLSTRCPNNPTTDPKGASHCTPPRHHHRITCEPDRARPSACCRGPNAQEVRDGSYSVLSSLRKSHTQMYAHRLHGGVPAMSMNPQSLAFAKPNEFGTFGSRYAHQCCFRRALPGALKCILVLAASASPSDG